MEARITLLEARVVRLQRWLAVASLGCVAVGGIAVAGLVKPAPAPPDALRLADGSNTVQLTGEGLAITAGDKRTFISAGLLSLTEREKSSNLQPARVLLWAEKDSKSSALAMVEINNGAPTVTLSKGGQRFAAEVGAENVRVTTKAPAGELMLFADGGALELALDRRTHGRVLLQSNDNDACLHLEHRAPPTSGGASEPKRARTCAASK